jgi:Tfp pilus assembly protein PilN
MLRTNLATRPFYNNRAVRFGIAVAVLLALGLTLFNVAQILTLSARNGELARRAEDAEDRARARRDQAAATRKTLDEGAVTQVQAGAREANLLIERRTFSWTELFNRFEETLPADVRIAAVQPQVDLEGRMLVAVTVVSRRVEDLNDFMEQLEQTGAFREVLSRQEVMQDDGTLRSVIQGYYGGQVVPPVVVDEPAPADAGDHPAAPPPPGRAALQERRP